MNLHELSDTDLLQLLVSDNAVPRTPHVEKAFRVLYERYHPFVLKKCLRFIKDPDQAMDIAQAVFIKLHHRYHSFEAKATFKTWLYTITYRECLNFLRDTKKLSFQSINLGELEKVYGHVNIEEDVDMDAARNLALLDQIEPFDKALLLMKYKDGIKIKTIAKGLQLSEASIKMRLKRAKGRLLKLRQDTQK